jgi:hypothetical protein
MPDYAQEHGEPLVKSSGKYKLSPTEKNGYQVTDEKGTLLIDGISYFSVEHSMGQLPQVNLIFSASIDVEMPTI